MQRVSIFAFLAMLLLSAGQDDGTAAVPEGESEEPNYEEVMSEVDKDKDGKLTWQELFESEDAADMPKEALEKYKKVFEEQDKNSDGFVDVTELKGLFDAFGAVEEDEEPAKEEM